MFGRPTLCIFLDEVYVSCWLLYQTASFLCMCRETLAMCNFSGGCKHANIKSHTLRVSVGVLLFSSCCIYNSWLSDFTALLEFHCVFLNKVALLPWLIRGRRRVGHVLTRSASKSPAWRAVFPRCWSEVESCKEQIHKHEAQ